jgi:hypothetical protein
MLEGEGRDYVAVPLSACGTVSFSSDVDWHQRDFGSVSHHRQAEADGRRRLCPVVRLGQGVARRGVSIILN